MSKKIFIDYDSTLCDYSDYLFKEINDKYKSNEEYVQMNEEKFHKNKNVIKKYISLKGKEAEVMISSLFERINIAFELEPGKINLDNMGRYWKKVIQYHSDNKEIDNLINLINEYFENNKIYKEVSLENITSVPEEIKDFYDNFSNMGYYKDMKFFKGAIDFLKTLKKEGFEIIIITASMSPEQKEYKTEHMNKYISEYISEIIHTKKKYEHSVGYPMVDDKFSTIVKHCELSDTKGYLLNFESNQNKGADNSFSYTMEEVEEAEKAENFEYVTGYEDILKSLGIKIEITNKKGNTKT